jgi:hypothetical protein
VVQKYGVLVKIFNVLKTYNLDFESCIVLLKFPVLLNNILRQLNSLTISNSDPFNVNFKLVDCLPLEKTITLV